LIHVTEVFQIPYLKIIECSLFLLLTKISFKYSDIKDAYKEIPITETLNDITEKNKAWKKLYKKFNYSKTDFRAHNGHFFYKGQDIEGYFWANREMFNQN